MKGIHRNIILILLLYSGLGFPKLVSAQSGNSVQDLSSVNVDELSDDQIRAMIQRAQTAGISQSQMEQQAAQRGMPQDQIQKLDIRINKLPTADMKTSGKSNPTNKSINRVYTNNETNKGNKNFNDTSASLEPNFDLIFDRIRTKNFGEDIFNNQNLTFEPNLRLATPVNYVIGIDDELLIDIYGFSEANYKITVSPEGTIRIPNLGPIFVNGLIIELARKKISASLKALYPGIGGSHPSTFVNVNLGNIRSIKVFIVGEVKMPGTYTLPSLATVFNALYSCGGPNKNGSFRDIELIRNNQVIKIIDVYKFLVDGFQKENISLRDQDVIKVSPYINRIEFRGEVKKPGIFEIIPGEKLSKILQYAGGFSDKAYTHRIKIIQNDTREKTVYDVSESNYASYNAHRGDLYIIEPIINRYANRVQITGSIFRPGIYALDSSLTAGKLIKKADGLKEDAFTSRATIFRLNDKLTPEIINFDVSKIVAGTERDILLHREDSIVIYSRSQIQEKYTVTIGGEVIRPDTVPWAINLHLQDLILQAGGLTDAASEKRVEITRRVKDSDPLSENAVISRVFRIDLPLGLGSLKEHNDFVLEPFDDVIIRILPGYSVPQYVNVLGEVLYNGRYAIQAKNQRISDLIKESGGLTPQAFTEGATLIRQNSNSKVERDKRRQLLIRLSSKPKDSVQITKQLFQLDSTNQRQALPVGINLKKILLNPGSKFDLVLIDGDTVKIPQRLETVRISGDVLYPVRVRFDKSLSLTQYISSAGGFAPNAAKKRTYILYANGSVKGTSRFIFFNNYPSVLPGAQIIVPDRGVVRKASVAELVGIGSSITTLVVLLLTVFKK